MDRHPEVRIGLRGDRHTELFLDRREYDVVELEHHVEAISRTLDGARQQPICPELIPQRVVDGSPGDAHRKRIDDGETVAVPEVPGDDRLDLRRDGFAAESTVERQDRDGRHVSVS